MHHLDKLREHVHLGLERGRHLHVHGRPGMGKTSAVRAALEALGAEVFWIPLSPEVEGPELVVSHGLDRATSTLVRGALYRAACVAAAGGRAVVHGTEAQRASTAALQYISMLADGTRTLRCPSGENLAWGGGLSVVLESNPPWSMPDWIRDRFVHLAVPEPSVRDVEALLASLGLVGKEGRVIAELFQATVEPDRRPSLRNLTAYVAARFEMRMTPAEAARATFLFDRDELETLASIEALLVERGAA